jgi:hypothetical protein
MKVRLALPMAFAAILAAACSHNQPENGMPAGVKADSTSDTTITVDTMKMGDTTRTPRDSPPQH